MKGKYFIVASLLGWVVCCQAEVRSVRMRWANDADMEMQGERAPLQRPFLVLSDGVVDGTDPANTLEVSFDEMSHDVHFYTYTLVHLNADGKPSDLTTSEYIHGFTTCDITDYAHSVNTQRDYTHYTFRFPNEDMQPTCSGLYALHIYEDGNRDNTIAYLPFVVVDPRVGISAKVHSKTIKGLNSYYQQVDIDIETAALGLRDPNELRVVVRQNGRTDNEAVLTQPTFVENSRLRYINQSQLVFEGGNEYRHFDAYSTYYAGTGIDRIAYDNRDYHALLFEDRVKEGIYIHEYDVDGQYRINAERTQDSDTEAEYMWVHWQLACDKPWFDGSVYVGGDLFGNAFSAANRMQYDHEAQCYYLVSLVKQGGYDYQYWFLPKGSTNAVGVSSSRPATTAINATNTSRLTTTLRTEGSYWQTENEYTIYVFYRPFGARGDQLVGISTVHSA